MSLPKPMPSSMTERVQNCPHLPACTSCGACCSPDADPGLALEITQVEAARIGPLKPSSIRLTVDKETGRTHWWMHPVKRKDGRHVCPFLKGRIGHECSCEIYNIRPAECRAFRSGCAICLKAIAHHGVTIKPAQPAQMTAPA